MTISGGIKSALDASVFSASAAAFLLALIEKQVTRRSGGAEKKNLRDLRVTA